jgi:hypothetical protein
MSTYKTSLSVQALYSRWCLLLICYLWIKRQIRHLNGRVPDRHQVCVKFRLGLCCEHLQFHDFVMTSACCPHSFLTKSYMQGILNATCKMEVGVHPGKLPMVRSTFFCRGCNCKKWLSATNSQADQAHVIMDLINALQRVNSALELKRPRFKRG